MWFGSEDGDTPNTNYEHDTFNMSVVLEIHSGMDAGILFRSSSVGTRNDAGPTYVADLNLIKSHCVFSKYYVIIEFSDVI